MNKRIILPIVIGAFAGLCSPVFSQNESDVRIGEDCYLSKAVIEEQEKVVVKQGGTPCYEVTTRSSSEVVKLFFVLKNIREDTLKMAGIKWFKATMLSAPSEEHEQFNVETYYDSNSAFQFAPNLTFFKSKNKELVSSITGIDLIGMPIDEVVSMFGEGVMTPAGNGSRYMHNIKDIVAYASDEKIYFYASGNRVTEIAYECEHDMHISAAMKSFWGYQPVNDGWFTKGECTGTDVNVRAFAPDGEILGKISSDSNDAEVMVLETATTGEEFNWVKIVTKSGLTGWVYGKYVRPGLFGTSFEQTLNNSIEYCEWLSSFLQSPSHVEEDKNADGTINGFTKVYEGHTVKTVMVGLYKDIEEFDSIEYTDVGYSHNNRFCGLGVGDNIEAANIFAGNLLLADAVPFEKGQKFSEDCVLHWRTVGQDAEITVEMRQGMVSRIIVTKTKG